MSIRLSTLTVLVVIVLSLALSGCSQPTQSSTGMGNMGMDHAVAGHGVTDAKAPFEQQFIDMMVPHHEGAVEMAKVAQARAERPEIRQMADAIISAQDREIQQMKGWRQAWYGSDQTPAMASMPMLPEMRTNMGNMAEDVKKLQTAVPFDKAFIDAMIPHHEAAIEAAKIAQQRATKSEIKQLAGDIVAAQEREIAQMRDWRKAWFGS